MKAVMVMFDSLNRHMLNPYGFEQSITPNFTRLGQHTLQFENCFAGSLPCMPARRELHTGRYNFLHRSWGPMEPFDDSMPELLKNNGVHSHLASDHNHYWEDGGATYHTRYTTWQAIRGQEGDPWMGVVGGVEDERPNLIQFEGYRGKLYQQDLVNRSFAREEADFPQARTFAAGLDFIKTNHAQDRWFLQLETFDPHEPFFCAEKYKQMYPSGYTGPRFDWPDYAAVQQTPEQVDEARRAYWALLSMCDAYLGQVLDLFDQLDLWQDTLLIVNTDHGYLLGEHGYWAKNYMPLYNEIARIPLFIWDPRQGLCGQTRQSLVQTIDLAPTILSFFGIAVPPDMQGKDLAPVIAADTPLREAALFGIHGGHVCVTDGRYVYMKAPACQENQPLYNYTLMPTHMPCFFTPAEIKTMERQQPFSFTKEMPVMKFDAGIFGANTWKYGDLLFDLQEDPGQQRPVKDQPQLVERMQAHLLHLMRQSDAPPEQYKRLGLI